MILQDRWGRVLQDLKNWNRLLNHVGMYYQIVNHLCAQFKLLVICCASGVTDQMDHKIFFASHFLTEISQLQGSRPRFVKKLRIWVISTLQMLLLNNHMTCPCCKPTVPGCMQCLDPPPLANIPAKTANSN